MAYLLAKKPDHVDAGIDSNRGLRLCIKFGDTRIALGRGVTGGGSGKLSSASGAEADAIDDATVPAMDGCGESAIPSPYVTVVVAAGGPAT